MADINESLLDDVIKVLEPFDEHTKRLSTDSKPSLHLVVPAKIQLSKHLTPLATDCSVIVLLKNHLHAHLQKYFTVTKIHLVATLLDPRARNNSSILSSEEQISAITSLRQMVNDVTSISENESDSGSSSESGQPCREPAKKKLKLNDSMAPAAADDQLYDDLYATSSSLNTDEVTLYLIL